MKRRNITIISIIVAVILFIILTIVQDRIRNSEPKTTVVLANYDI